MPTIRPATAEDHLAINTVSQHLGYSALSDSESLTALTTLLASESNSVYVAFVGNELVGWIHTFLAHRLASPSFYEIGGLVVDPRARDQGIGRALVNHAAEAQQGTLRVRCNIGRTGTHRFYKRIGFQESKDQRVFERTTPDA